MILTDNWRIEYDTNNVILVFFEQREKVKKDGTITKYEHTENFYYPTVQAALMSFTNKYLIGSGTVEQLVFRIDKIHSIIKQLKTA